MRPSLSLAVAFVLVLGAAAGIIVAVSSSAPDPVQLAAERAGTARYALEYLRTPVGEYETATRVTADRVVFETRLMTRLPGQSASTIEERLEFETRRPFRLVAAVRFERTGSRVQQLELVPVSGGYEARRTRAGERERLHLDWQYDLAQHLALELTLTRGVPSDAPIAVHHLDLQALRPVPRRWELHARTADGGYLLRDAADAEDSWVHLDEALVPRTVSVAGLFSLRRSDVDGDEPGFAPGLARADAVAMAGARLLEPGTAFVALSSPIAEPMRVERATLRVPANAAAALASVEGLDWQPHDEPGYRLLTLTADERRRASGEHAGSEPYPSTASEHPTIRRLAARVLRPGTPASEQVRELVAFVHGFLHYRADSQPLDLLDAVAAREGNCTEFANLFTAMARAAGLHARTVTGLAYAEDAGPGFYFHAWNEVLVDGYWQRVDPTFGTTRVAATHIAFPDGTSAFLRAYAALVGQGLEVRELVYFDS